MSTSTPAAPQPLFIPVSRFKQYGLPGRTRAYELDKLGLLDLRKLDGRAGVTLAEAQRFVASAVPLAEVKRDTRRGTAASLRSRGHRA